VAGACGSDVAVGQNAGVTYSWTVRAPIAADYDCWRDLYGQYAAFYKVAQPDEHAERVWSWIHDRNHVVKCLLAVDESGHVVGLAHYRPFPQPLEATTGCYLDDLFVDPAARGSGAVDALLDELVRIAREHGWDGISWITAEDNYRARAKYDQRANRARWVTYELDLSNEPPHADD
jgi:ribosomal protein S18 acetylase RimI-like enzyme